MTGRFTGWHMAGVLVAMYGTIVAVNFVMARYAIGTFGGVVVENSYVASQRYNRWLAEARAQKALGWTVDASLDGRRHLVVGMDLSADQIAGAVVMVAARHPLGLEPEHIVHVVRTGAGTFTSEDTIKPGRWLVRITVRAAGRQAVFDDEVPA